jgi:hypothetical protein
MDKRCAPNRYTEKCSLSASCVRKRAAGLGTSYKLDVFGDVCLYVCRKPVVHDCSF